MAPREADVIVVGSGVAGLVAARNCVRAGLSVYVLEALDRYGGRMYGKVVDEKGTYVDLGGQWIGPTQDRFRALLDDYAIETFDIVVKGDSQIRYRGETYRCNDINFALYADGDDTWPSNLGPEVKADLRSATDALFALAARLPAEALPISANASTAADRQLMEDLDAQTVSTWIGANCKTEFARFYMAAQCRLLGPCGPAEPMEASMLFFTYGMRVASQREFPEAQLIHGGAGQVPAKLVADIGADRVVVSSPVHTLVTSGDGSSVTVTTEDGVAYRGRRVIVAASPEMCSTMVFSPLLPAERDLLTRRYPMGVCAKVLVSYERPFWNDRGLSGHVIADGVTVEACADASDPLRKTGVIAAFVVGRRYLRWHALPTEEARKAAVLADLAQFLGEEANSPVSFNVADWPAQPYVGGGYGGYMPPGVMSSYGSALQAPCGLIHWASTEHASRWTGFFDGAIRSGERAASDVIAHLKA